MAKDRFDKLEGPGSEGKELPPGVKDALNRLDRFKALEIGIDPAKSGAAPKSTDPAPVRSAASPPVTPPAAAGGVSCVHCDQVNEPDRETCWACYRYVRVKAEGAATRRAPDDITLVLDGVTYTSNQKDLPDDVAELMKRIRKRGYSHELLVEWRQWRVTRHAKPLERRPFEEPADRLAQPDAPVSGSDESLGIKVFRGDRVSVIRMDGKVYTSDDPNLTPELKQLFAYIDAHGVTPALMDYLRQMGEVKVRPPTTAYPSDGDLAFWGQVQKQSGPAAPRDMRESADTFVREQERRRAETELAQARGRYEGARGRGVMAMVGLGFFFLYLLLSIFLR